MMSPQRLLKDICPLVFKTWKDSVYKTVGRMRGKNGKILHRCKMPPHETWYG